MGDQNKRVFRAKIAGRELLLVDELILAVGALEVVVLGAGLLGQALGVIDQAFGLFLSEIHEDAASNLEDMVDKPFESRSVGDGQIALEDHAVKARGLIPKSGDSKCIIG